MHQPSSTQNPHLSPEEEAPRRGGGGRLRLTHTRSRKQPWRRRGFKPREWFPLGDSSGSPKPGHRGRGLPPGGHAPSHQPPGAVPGWADSLVCGAVGMSKGKCGSLGQALALRRLIELMLTEAAWRLWTRGLGLAAGPGHAARPSLAVIPALCDFPLHTSWLASISCARALGTGPLPLSTQVKH